MQFFGRLRYPWLFAIAATLFLFDLVIPDLLPLADEILLAVVTVLLASRKNERADEPESGDVIDITPED
ncbi:MAG: hypothetical protein GKS06_08820 [Acidobacteria bacterium]|nr:hypothetical protein [Acidobacteriota bacterium]